MPITPNVPQLIIIKSLQLTDVNCTLCSQSCFDEILLDMDVLDPGARAHHVVM
jgi:hypothetical protein